MPLVQLAGLLFLAAIGAGGKPVQTVRGATPAPAQEWPQGEFREPTTGIEFVWIEPATFMMGSPPPSAGVGGSLATREYDDQSPHLVTITRGFYLSKHEVSQWQWEAVMRTTPWLGRQPANTSVGPDYPAVWVSWYDAVHFAQQLSSRVDGWCFRLPTEAEWEYAARAGDTRAVPEALEDVAWLKENSGGRFQPVGTKLPNEWGLYDMHGNVMEWVADWYRPDYYRLSPLLDPRGPETPWEKGAFRVLRGCTAVMRREFGMCRTALRSYFQPVAVNPDIGFRLVMERPAAARRR